MSTALTFDEQVEIELGLQRMREEDGKSSGPAGKQTEILWTPHPANIPQQLGYNSLADVLGFGGQAAGGKSDLLLGLAFTRHRVSKIFRREASQLVDMIDRAREIVGDLMNLNGMCRMTDGRRVNLLGVKDQKDVDKHKGRPADLFGFDEATEFTEAQIRFLIGWNRSAYPGQRCRAVLCFNPPTNIEGMWILDYFGPWLRDNHPNPAKPGELRFYATLHNGQEIERPDGEPFYDQTAPASVPESLRLIKPRSRTFIPASLKDNPYLSSTDYQSVLQSLPEPLRSQLLRGDFKAGIKDDPWQVIPTEWVKMAQARWMASGGRRPENTILNTIGVDVSRGGKDKTTVARRYGHWFAPIDSYAGEMTDNGMKVAALVGKSVSDSGVDYQPDINIDADGVGTSPYDILVEQEYRITAVHNGDPADEDAKDKSGTLGFINQRAQHYWKLREALHPVHGENLEIPPDAELLADLCAAKWELKLRGIQIEDKKQIAKRIGRSPDKGDAFIMSTIIRPMPVGGLGLGAVKGWGIE